MSRVFLTLLGSPRWREFLCDTDGDHAIASIILALLPTGYEVARSIESFERRKKRVIGEAVEAFVACYEAWKFGEATPTAEDAPARVYEAHNGVLRVLLGTDNRGYLSDIEEKIKEFLLETEKWPKDKVRVSLDTTGKYDYIRVSLSKWS